MENVNWKLGVFTAAVLSAAIYAAIFGSYIASGASGEAGRYVVLAAALSVVMPIVGWVGQRFSHRGKFRSLATGFALAPFPGGIVLLEVWLIR
jgi:hypothetical protein